MNWYYADGSERRGPFSDEQFDGLVRAGAVGAATMVWHEGLTTWQPYHQVAGKQGMAACSQCGRVFPVDDLLNYQNTLVCAECKPLFLQRLREGGVAAVVGAPGTFHYAGFWIRAVALGLDVIALVVVMTVMNLVTSPIVSLGAMSQSPVIVVILLVVCLVVELGVLIGYEPFFIGRWGATLGKMAIGVRVVRPDGSRVGYGRAIGRLFARILSGMIFYIGYIMAGIDDQKRALHDMICDTRVVYK